MAELEAKVFHLGKWKDFDELEENLSLPELSAILVAKQDRDHEERKFLAAIQGIDIDEGNESNQSQGNAWEDLKAKVFSGGAATDGRDIVSLQGINAQQAGFGIGMGLDYESVGKDSVNPMSP